MPTPSLLQRLKERKLVQWALAYLAGSFVSFQLLDAVEEALGLTPTIQRTILVVVVIGFFVTLVLAWYHGEKGRQRASGPELLMVAALLVVAGVAITLLHPQKGANPRVALEGDDRPGIAVFPCESWSPDPEDAYFASGIHDEILLHLQKISGLRSIGRESMEWYGANPLPMRQIAQELGVGFLGECSVLKDVARNQIRLTFQLVDGNTGAQVLAERYDEDLSARSIFDIHTDVARQVAHAVGAVLTPEEEARIASIPTESPEAYDFYLRGRDFWNRRTLAAFDSAIDYFSRAILLDPSYARAYAALAETYVLLPEFGGPAIPEILPLAKAATERALSLDPGLAEAYAASGYLKAVFEWERDASEQDLLKAIELNPDCATAHYWYAELLGVTRRWGEALREARRALELDPLSVGAHGYVGLLLMDSGRSEEAIPVFEQALEIAPLFENQVYLLATAHTLRGDYTAAAPLYDRVAELTGTDPEAYRAFLAALSDPAKTPAAVIALQASNVYGDVGRGDYLAQLGRLDEALAALEQAYEARRPYLPWVNAHPWYEPLRSDPRFQDLLRRMNFPG